MLSPNRGRRKAQHQTRNGQQVVYNTTETYIGKPDKNTRTGSTPKTNSYRRDQAHQRVLQTRSNRSTTAAYKDGCRLLHKRTRALKSDWWERKAVELQRTVDRNDMKSFYNGLKEVWGPKKKGPIHLKQQMGCRPTLTIRELWKDGVNTSRSYSTFLAI